MVTLKIISKYHDIELEQMKYPNDIVKVTPARAKKLTGMGLAEIIKIDKLSKKEYAEIKG